MFLHTLPFLVILVCGQSLQPLKTVYHYPPTNGDWLGARIPDHVVADLRLRRRLDTAAESLRGDVALTTATGVSIQGNGAAVGTCDAATAKCTFAVDENVYGPFEAGFGTQQDSVIQSQMGCADYTKCYSEGGMDVAIAESICANECGITLPRTQDNTYYAFLDTCGGHTKDYHFHRDPACLYTEATNSGHSAQVAKVMAQSSRRLLTAADQSGHGNRRKLLMGGKGGPGGGTTSSNGQLLYGKWENYATKELPKLDACGGHYGVTPDSGGKTIYHYQTQEHPPFTLGCIGPNGDGSLVSVQQCRDINDACSETARIQLFTIKNNDGSTKAIPYQPDCPCWDASGSGLNGAGLNVGNVAPSRAWFTLHYVNGAWEDLATGTFASHSDFQNGFTIVELPAITAGAAAPSGATDGTDMAPQGTTAPSTTTPPGGLSGANTAAPAGMTLLLASAGAVAASRILPGAS